ncbi:hypothetical protein HKX48_007179 [Thoreauomyces humboldtii]|nr:hypothetical protein HKX48_007179 [Thoreauomyces humboldtii]
MKKREYKEKGNRAKERLRVLRRDLAASQSVETTRPAIPRGTQSASSSGSPAATLGAPLTSKSWTPKSLQTRDSLYDFQVTHSDRWTRKPRTLLLNDFNDLAVVSVLAGELHVYDTASRSPLKVIPHSDLNNYFSEHIAWLREGVLATAMVEKSSQTKPKREPVIDQALSLVYDCEVQRNGSFTYKVQHLTRNFPHEKGVTFILPLESSDDYTRWVTGSADKKICLWGYEGNFRGTPGGDYTPVATQPLHSLHTAMITAIHYNPHSQRLYSGGLDSRLIAWDIANEVNTLPYVALEGKGKIRDITAIPTHPNLMLIGFSDGSQTMKLWDERTKSFVLDLGQAEQGKNDNTRYTHPSVHPNGYLVASGLQTGQIAIYDLRHAGVDRGPTQLINAHSNRVVQTAFKTNRLDHGREQLLSIGNDCVLTYNSYRRALNERIQNVG